MTTHKCTVCGQEKPRSEFRWNPKFGTRGECKECEKTILRCAKCGEMKAHEDFPPCKRTSTGRHGWCLECHRKKQLAYWDNPEFREKHKQDQRKEVARSYRRQYHSRPEVKAKARARDKERYKKAKASPGWAEKQRARAAATYAVRKGILVKPKRCQANGKYGTRCCKGRLSMHHHKGYAPEHALDVEWLCSRCHAAADVMLRDGTLAPQENA